MARKALTLKQAEAQLAKNQEKYREYVKAQTAKKDGKTKKEQDAAQKKMDSLREAYTSYRTALRDFYAAGGTRRTAKKAPAKKAPAKGKGKTQSTAKKNNGSQGKNGSEVVTRQATDEEKERLGITA